MKEFLVACLFCFGSAATSFAGSCEKPSVGSVPVPQAAVVTQPSPTVVQQQVVMVPQTQIVEVERTITDFVPQVRTEIVQQEICVMVPEVRDVVQTRCCEVQQGYVARLAYGYAQQQPVSYGKSLTDKQMAMLYAQRALDDMEIEGESPRKVRRAKRRVAMIQRRVQDAATRGGY